MSEQSIEADRDLQLLENQLCFPLYAASRLMTRAYQPLLARFQLTYPQYIILLILWEDAPCPIRHIGTRAILETNTLSPLLKTLEKQGWVTRTRSVLDERVVMVDLTDKGRAMKKECACIPQELFEQTDSTSQDLASVKAMLNQLVTQLQETL